MMQEPGIDGDRGEVSVFRDLSRCLSPLKAFCQAEIEKAVDEAIKKLWTEEVEPKLKALGDAYEDGRSLFGSPWR